MKKRRIPFLMLLIQILFWGCEKNIPLEIEYPLQLSSDRMSFKAYLSPNGNYVAYSSQKNTHNPEIAAVYFEIFIVDSDGNNLKNLLLVNDIYQSTHISFYHWAPSSDYLIVGITTEGINNIYEFWKVGLDGNRSKLLEADSPIFEPKISPDGERIIYMDQVSSDSLGSPIFNLYCGNIDFQDTVILECGLIGNYDWINNQEIVFSLYDRKDNNYDLWKVSISGQKTRMTSTAYENENDVACSDNGIYLAYSVDKSVSCIDIDKKRSTGLWLKSAHIIDWIPTKNVLAVFGEQLVDNRSWHEVWLVDLEGNIVLKLDDKVHNVSFSTTGDTLLYSKDGCIWLDNLSLPESINQ